MTCPSGAGINPAACRSLTNSITIISLNEVNVQLNVTGAINNTFCNGEMLSLLFQLLLVQTMSLN